MSYDEDCNDLLAKEPRQQLKLNYNSGITEEDNLSTTKPYVISKSLVVTAYKLVKANKGAAGVDQQTLGDFDLNLKDNLYKIWSYGQILCMR